MSFGRVPFEKNANRMPQPLRSGDGMVANFSPTVFAAETDATLAIFALAGGLVHQGTTLTSDVIYTLPLGAAIAAAFAGMNVADAYSFVVTNAQAAAFDVVLAVDTGVTAVGANNTISVPPQSSRIFTLIKTGAATFDLY